MFETCDWNDEGEGSPSAPETSVREKTPGAQRTETTSRKNRLKRNRQLLDVLRSLNTPSTLHPDLPPPPEATPPKKLKKHATDVTSDMSPPEDSPAGAERPLESAERLSRRQWRNKLKNKKKNRNKFKAVTGTSGARTEGAGTTAQGAGGQGAGAGGQGAGATTRGAGGQGAGAATRGAGGQGAGAATRGAGGQGTGTTTQGGGAQGAGATMALDETPRNRRKGKQNGYVEATPPERARLQKLKEMMKRERTETPSPAEEDPHNIQTPETDTSEAGGDRSAELRSRMEQRLNAARFRYINQQLYTLRSQDARDLFLQDPQAFSLYHSGFSQQVQRWPVNPITQIIKYIKNRPSSLVVADFGCGDALLARSVRNTVHSFDLVALNDRVTVCDIAEVPLPDGSVDVAVFCLSLMGTNLSDFLQEAFRVLKPGGVLLVAEVSSRFDDVRQFLSAMSQLGFKVVNKNTENSHFFLFEFSKTGRARDATKHPGLQLKPCLYKKR